MPETFVHAIAHAQAQHLRALATLFAELREHDKDGYGVMVRAALTYGGITNAHMADALGVMMSTPSQWAKGRTSPHPVILDSVRDWLVKELLQRADMLEAFPEELGEPEDNYIPQRLRPPAHEHPRT